MVRVVHPEPPQDLAHHQQALNSRRGAAFGFAGIARLAAAGGEGGLTQHIGALLPKLYRYQVRVRRNQRCDWTRKHLAGEALSLPPISDASLRRWFYGDLSWPFSESNRMIWIACGSLDHLT